MFSQALTDFKVSAQRVKEFLLDLAKFIRLPFIEFQEIEKMRLLYKYPQ